MKKHDSRNRPSPPAPGGLGQHLELLAAMGADFASCRDLEATLAGAVERITDHIEAEGGALFLLDEAAETLRCSACHGGAQITGLVIGADQGIVGRCVQSDDGQIIRDVREDPAFFGGVDEKTGFVTRSILCAPLSVRGECFGAIELVNKRGGDGLFDGTDLKLLQGLAASAALAIVNARQAEALMEQERVRRELELAAEIQRSLLPAPRPEPFPVHGANRPARTVSGDFYDFFELPGGRIGFSLGDVAGKGMNAALLMAKTAGLYRCLGKTETSPGRLLGIINDEICETATRGLFVTMVGGLFDPGTGRVVLANAGHEPPLLRDAEGNWHSFPASAPPLGVLPGEGDKPCLAETEIDLAGGTLYVFTDGVTEGFVEDGRALEVEGLKALIAENEGLPAADRIAAVIDRLHRRGHALRDDLTLLAVTGRAAAASLPGEGLMRFSFEACPAELKRVRRKLIAGLKEAGCPRQESDEIVLAVDEACQNVIRHAYGETSPGAATLELRRDGDDLIILLRDFAETVDPATVRPRDLDDIRPGGLGTHVIREIMDRVEFVTPTGNGGNLLRMVKSLKRGEPA